MVVIKAVTNQKMVLFQKKTLSVPNALYIKYSVLLRQNKNFVVLLFFN